MRVQFGKPNPVYFETPSQLMNAKREETRLATLIATSAQQQRLPNLITPSRVPNKPAS